MKLFAALPLLALGNNCPSDRCWSYDEETKACSINADQRCMAFRCMSNGMDIEFDSDVFGITSEDSQDWGSSGPAPQYNGHDGVWQSSPVYGTDGVTFNINNEENTITFHKWIQLAGNNRQRSGAPPGTIIDLGEDLDVHTTPNGINIKFSCKYSMAFTLSTEDFEVDHITSFGSNVGTGDMSSAFAMTLSGSNADGRYIMGGNMILGVQWAVTTLNELTFYFTDCNVVHGAVDVPVIKNSCYAGVTNAAPLDNTSTYQSFTWQIFKGLGQEEATQTVTCQLQMCRVGECGHAIDDADCPQDGNYAYNAGN